jgi:predicted RNA-binding protein
VCLATVYVQDGEHKEDVMRDVALVEPNDSALRLVSLLGQSRLLRAKIIAIDLLNSSIIVQRTAADRGEEKEVGPD